MGWRPPAAAAFWGALAVLPLAVGDPPVVLPRDDACASEGLYFDPTALRCETCSSIDPAATLISGAGSAPDVAAGAAGQCACAGGYVQCAGGELCGNGTDGGSRATRALECRQCPIVDGNRTAPTQDRRRCMPCAVDGDDSTFGFSDALGDCACPPGHALVERQSSGEYLSAKRCAKCADGMLPGPAGQDLAVYDCRPCPDVLRQERNPRTGMCVCKSNSPTGNNFVSTGGACIASDEYTLVNDKFPQSAAVLVTYKDLVDGREAWFKYGPFGHNVGISERGENMMDVLRLDETTRVDTPTVSSSTLRWLYMRCAVECHTDNATSCQCISNLCALLLYDDTAVVCRYLTGFLYQGREVVQRSKFGYGVEGMPWLLYADSRPEEIRADTSLDWEFTLSNDFGGRSGVANTLKFWLAKYSLEGSWLGWEKLSDQLDLCATLGGTSAGAQSPPYAWRRFASSLVTRCHVLLHNILRCGVRPVFYEMFAENVDGYLVPVPVRILNLVKDQRRPNLNFVRSIWYMKEDLNDDVFVRRFTLCDSASGRGGGPEEYLDPDSHTPQVFRWAAHMAVEVNIRPDAEGKIYVPILSIAYAEKKAADLDERSTTWVSFKAEYAMPSRQPWTTLTIVMVLLILIVGGCRMYLADRRYPNYPMTVPGGDPSLFFSKIAVQVLLLLSTTLAVLFWFHFFQSMYWLVFFKSQDSPHVLLPSAFNGDQYVPHDIVMVILMCLSAVVVVLELLRHLKVFIFLVDWERGAPLAVPNQGPLGGLGDRTPLTQQPYGQFPSQVPGGTPGSALFSQNPALGGFGAMQQHQQHQQHVEGDSGAAPDSGISAWRTLFICNQLNERLASTRTLPHVTWLTMCALLEGLDWKNAARWYPRFDGDEGLLSAQYNPFLQYALGVSTWLFTILIQLLVIRIGGVWLGHDCHTFVDACSVANVSVLVMDEPYHGYYIHGKAPSNRGDWCHTDLAKVLHEEDKGIGLSRGLPPDGACQTFEMYLPPEMAVQLPGGMPAHFRSTLCKVYGDVNSLLLSFANMRPEKPSVHQLGQMSLHRCTVQSIVDSMVHAVMRGASEVVRPRKTNWFWGTIPFGGVQTLRQPVFLKDLTGLSWLSSLAYGSGLRVAGVELPIGFEWYVGLLEMLTFQLCWRFQGSIYLGTALAFIVNQVVLGLYAFCGRRQLAYTTMINPVFLVGGTPRAQSLIFGVVALAFFVDEVSRGAG